MAPVVLGDRVEDVEQAGLLAEQRDLERLALLARGRAGACRTEAKPVKIYVGEDEAEALLGWPAPDPSGLLILEPLVVAIKFSMSSTTLVGASTCGKWPMPDRQRTPRTHLAHSPCERCTSMARTPSTSTANSPNSTPTATALSGHPPPHPTLCHRHAGPVSYAEPSVEHADSQVTAARPNGGCRCCAGRGRALPDVRGGPVCNSIGRE